ncbi:GM22309 [Drosophila sechellia]|uniref:GM22309 n=1 Tax=Drosophila sechellia TaxID=7238 RepID=B4IAD6_DROSE|nr:GM22309 [Drosophila sechellia]
MIVLLVRKVPKIWPDPLLHHLVVLMVVVAAMVMMMVMVVTSLFLSAANSNNYSRNPSIHPGKHPVYELPKPVQVPGSSWMPPPTDLMPPAPLSPHHRYPCGKCTYIEIYECPKFMALGECTECMQQMQHPKLQLATGNLQDAAAAALPLWSSAPKCGP